MTTENVDHDKLDELARVASAQRARDMGLEAGDEVANGESAYRIIEATDTKIKARMIAENGHSVIPGSPTFLDLRLPGWTVISKVCRLPVGGPA